MRVLYLLSSYPVVSETFVRREIELLSEHADVEVRALHPQELGADADAWAARANAHLSRPRRFARAALRPRLGLRMAGWLEGMPRRAGTLVRLLAAAPLRRPDHVHTHFASTNAIAARALARTWGASFGVTVHAHDLFDPHLPSLAAAARADLPLTICDYNRRYAAERLPGLDLEVLRTGVSERLLRPFAGRPRRETPVLLSVGRLVPKKGFDVLLGALAVLRARRPVELRIVGDGPDRQRLEELAGSLGVGESVRFAGELREAAVLDELDRCDAFVLASRPAASLNGGIDQDGLPVVLMEAMARGALAVSTPVAGIPELVADGETGFLAAEPSAPAVADAIERALDATGPDAVRARALERIRSDYLLERNVGRLAERMREVARA